LLEIVLLCAGCHGMNGEGRPEAGYPRLAGQLAPYLERQLEAYADGRRESIVMSPLARRLSAEERGRLAAHFSGAAAKPASAAPVTGSARGETLATVGDNRLRVQACQNCHGPAGSGRAPFGAYLAGLHATYIKAELVAWREGKRHTDPSGAMAVIARHLSAADIDAVAAYYSSLPPPAPR
jgi:cytochrome c553